MRRYLTIASLVLATVSVAACDTKTSSSSSSSASASGSNSSVGACKHWNNIRGDISAGILTDAELRSKVGEVRSSATSPAVEKAATILLAGITSRDKTDITAGLVALNAACK